MRKDLNMRKGKIAAQACHGAMAFLTRNMLVIKPANLPDDENYGYFKINFSGLKSLNLTIDELMNWLADDFTKICVSVNSEAELYDIYQKALEAGLYASMVTDSGKTEFDGIPTNTCISIGPHEASRIDAITGHLKLL